MVELCWGRGALTFAPHPGDVGGRIRGPVTNQGSSLKLWYADRVVRHADSLLCRCSYDCGHETHTYLRNVCSALWDKEICKSESKDVRMIHDDILYSM